MTGLKMKKSEKIELIEFYLEELFDDPKCELVYEKDYELLIAIVLSAQTTDKRVNSVTSVLFKKYNSLDLLKEASLTDLEEILRPLGSFRKKAFYVKEIANLLVTKYNYKVPVDRAILETFPGVGRKTVNVFFGEFYNIPAIAVDTHVERVSKRLGLAKDSDNVRTVEEKLEKAFQKEVWARRHLQLVLFGRYHCKAVSPKCEECKLKDICRYKKKTTHCE